MWLCSHSRGAGSPVKLHTLHLRRAVGCDIIVALMKPAIIVRGEACASI